MSTQPTAQTALTNGTATFTAAASGTPAPSVQWEVNTGSGTFAAVSDNAVYSGATTDTLTITDPTSAMNGYQYEAVFSNSVSSATSSAADADRRDRGRPQRDHAADRPDGPTNGTATFTAAANGTPTPSVQWEVNTGSGTFAAVSDNAVYSGSYHRHADHHRSHVDDERLRIQGRLHQHVGQRHHRSRRSHRRDRGRPQHDRAAGGPNGCRGRRRRPSRPRPAARPRPACSGRSTPAAAPSPP